MEKSLFIPLREEHLTTLKIRYDFKKDIVRFYAAREWESDLDFSRYNKDFIIDGILTDDAVCLNTGEVWALYEKYGLKDYLEQVVALVKAGKHFGIDAYYLAKYDIRYMMHEHSRKIGLTNRSQAIMAGGIRRHEPEEPEIEVIIDGLNLGRGMSFKNVAANVPFGGAKATVQMGPLDLTNLEIMGFLAFAMDSCRVLTSPDMNFPTEMSDVITQNGYSTQYAGGPSGKLGETGRPTAYGVYLSLKEAVHFYEGKETLEGKTVALMGLGAVGWYLGEHLLEGGVLKLTVADTDPAVVQKFIEAHPGYNIDSCPASEVIYQDVDILCPCAVGAILHDESIPKLQCRYIWGSANNQLKASSQEEEIRLAQRIADRGIHYQIDWYHNTAGVLCATEEYIYDGTYESLIRKIEDNVPAGTWNSLTEARENGLTPTENLYRNVGKILYE